MSSRAEYVPGPAFGARAEHDGERWTLVLVRELRHPPARVWEALTDPAHLREWAPFDADGMLDSVGATVHVTWTGTGRATEATVTQVVAPELLEFGDLRWELEPWGNGTRLTLWHNIGHRYITWGAAGWHICFDVLDRLLAGAPIGRIAGGDAMQFEWKRLVAEYAREFGLEESGGTSKSN
ncbi:MAG: SRPBCC domain-containing protein [Acidobacteriaceae bacterium]